MNNLRFQAWVGRAVSRIILPDDRSAVSRELMDHLEDSYEAGLGQGLSPAEAEARAIQAMGDAEAVALQPGQIHRPCWGLFRQHTRRVLVVLLCLLPLFLCGRVLVGYFFHGGYKEPVYYRYDPYQDTRVYDGAGTVERTMLFQPDAKASSDGYTFTLTDAALWHASYIDHTGQRQEEDYFHFRVRCTNPLPWANFDDTLRWFWAVDDLGNYYYAAYELGAADAPGIEVSVFHTGPLTYLYDMRLTDFVSQEAQWIELHYDRAGRDLTLRIDLTGGVSG